MPTGGGGGGGGGLASVTTDASLQGNGTAGTPLGLLKVTTDATLTGSGIGASPLSAVFPTIHTDSSLQGVGTVGSPLGILSVSTNATLTGAGTGGSPLAVAGFPVNFFSSGTWNTNNALPANNNIAISGIVIPYQLTFSHIAVNVNTADAVNNYDIGIYTAAGVLVADIGPRTLPSTGWVTFATVQGSKTIGPGLFIFAWTSVGTAAKITLQSQNNPWIYNTNVGSSTLAQLPGTITAQTVAPSATGNSYFVELY